MDANYRVDFNLWAQNTAQLLRENKWEKLDLEHLIEEVEDLSKSEKRGIASQLVRLLLHLLKWQYQPQRQSESWLDSIYDARLQIDLAIQDSPSLQTYPAMQLQSCYNKARKGAAKQTHLPLSALPETCPYSLDDILSEDWLPNT